MKKRFLTTKTTLTAVPRPPPCWIRTSPQKPSSPVRSCTPSRTAVWVLRELVNVLGLPPEKVAPVFAERWNSDLEENAAFGLHLEG